MSPSTHKHLAECESKELYCAWKGQLLVQEQQLCDIVLWSPFCGSIPAQLPAKLDIRHAVGISELRRQFPEAAFRRSTYINCEVSYQDILYHLYEVEILNKNGPKVEQFLECLKERDLALVRYLNGQGVLILLASTALVKEKDSGPDERTHFQALFLIPSPGPECLKAKDVRCQHREDERSVQVTLALPSLHYALLEAARNQGEGRPPPDALVKQHMQEFAKLSKNLRLGLDNSGSLPLSFDLPVKKPDLGALPEKCPQSSYHLLQFYLSHPQNYTLEMSAATSSLNSSSPSVTSSSTLVAVDASSLKLDPVPPKMPTNAIGASLESGSPVQSNPCDKDAPVKTSQMGDRPLQWCKRRSSRLLGASARKKWSPIKVLCMMENSKKRKKNAKMKKSLFPSFQARSAPSSYQRNSEPKAEFSEPTLKLKNLQNPLKRKRGAQVLSAEFVQDTREVSAPKTTSFSDGLDVSEKKPRLLRCKKIGGKLDSQEQMDIKRPATRRSARHSITETIPKNQMETGDENRPEGVTTATQDICSTQKREECDSHALNMLADLALSSCTSLLISNSSRTPPVYVSPSRDRRCIQKGNILCKSPDHEYHREMRNGKGGPPSDRTWQLTLSSPGQSSLTPDLPSSSRDLRPRRKGSMKPGPVKSHMVSPKESGDLSDSNMQSLICSEHSYASLSSESPKKGTATPVDSRNGVKHMKARPLVLPSKVLPFRHQQHLCQPRKRLKNCAPFMRPAVMARRLKEDFFKSHKVTFCDRTVKVAFQWEAEYLFSLDSKYTSHPLEKTVVRAVHGPWDANLPDDMEEMKLILHTWVALFYSKPFKSPTVRNVVEHSNPAKYVSLNSLMDPFEFTDDYEGSCSLEKCPADSPSEAAQTLSEGEERLFSSVEKPLSCNKLSSTNSIEEDEPPPANCDETGDWPLQEDPSPTAVCNSKDISPPFAMEAEKKTGKESLLDPLVSAESLNRISSCEQSDEHGSPQIFKVEVDSEANRGVNIIEVSQSDALTITADLPENSAGNEAAMLVKSQETNSASPSTEEEKSSHQAGVAELLPASEVAWVEAGAVHRVGDSPCRDVGESQDFPMEEEDANEESAEWESIDLALSESNDTDAEPQDEDLDQEETDMREERGTVTPSPNSSLFTSSASQPEPSDTQEVSELSASESASPSPVDLVEGSCFSQEDSVKTMAGSVLLQVSPLREDEETESTKSEDAAKHSVDQKQRDVDAILLISEEVKAIALTESSHEQASELSQVQREAAAPEELVKSQDSFESVRNPPFPNPIDLADISCASKEEKDNSLTDSCERQASPVHHTFAAEDTDFPRDQEASEPTEHCISPLQMGLIEDISQDGNEQERVGDTVQNCEDRQVQSSMLAQGKPAGNQEVPVVSAQNLAPSKEIDLVLGSSVLQEEEGISLANTTQLPGSPVCQTSYEITELLRNQEESVVTIKNVELLEQVDLAQDSCLHQEKETNSLPDTASFPNNDPLQVHNSTIIQKEQDSRQTECMNSSSAVKENHCLEEDNKEFESDSENGKCCVEDKHVRDSSVTQDVEPDGRKNQISGMVSEGIGPVCGTLVDPVSATAVENEKACAKDNSNLPWINSVNLENVTPPESDEESPVSDQFAHNGEKCVGNGYLQEGSIAEDLRRTTSESQGQSNSALQTNTKCNQTEIVEGKTPHENEAASTHMDIIPSSLCTFWAGTGTSSLECGLPLVNAAIPSKDDEPLDESTASKLCEVDVGQISQDVSMPEEEEHFKGASAEVSPCLPTEYPSESSSGEYDSLPPEDARANLEESEEALSSERTHLLTRVAGVNLKWDGESTFEGGDHEVAGDSDHSISESSCIIPSAAPSGDVEPATVCDLSLNQEISRSSDWIYLEDKEKMLDVEAETLKHDGSFASKGDSRLVMPSVENSNMPGLLKEYINFSVTMKHREKNRTFHSSKQHDCLTRELGSGHSWNKTWGIWNDPTENTLAMECLRFHFKVKQVLRKSQLSTSTATFANEFSSQAMTDALPLSNVPEGLALSPPPRCRSPLQITVRNPSQRHSSSYQYPRSSRYRNYVEPPPRPPSPPPLFVSTPKSLSKAARCKNQAQGPVSPFHLNKLTYNNKLKDFRSDISVIMDEFAELSTVMALDDRQMSNKGQGPLTTSEDASEKSGLFLTQRTVTYKHLFADLCNTLHFRLKNVAQEACKRPYSFFLLETDDDPFFGRLKNLLKKGGHPETDPLHFCKTSHVETDRLLVIIRNEDILSHIHKIPCLLRLKRFPSVTFAGVDSPEDILDHTYQELFHRGGFVVSDDKILEVMTLGELKKMVQTLENLQGHGRWRWLFHYKEMKQLREKARMDSAAHTKESLLKSCQGANITEVLHYHQCDSRSSSRADLVSCLLNLQVQHISERFAVFLTEKPNPSREAFENKGLLVLDVKTFLATAEDMAALFKSSSGWITNMEASGISR